MIDVKGKKIKKYFDISTLLSQKLTQLENQKKYGRPGQNYQPT